MGPAGGNQYRTTIGGFDRMGSFDVSVSATDSLGNTSTSGSITITVNPCIE